MEALEILRQWIQDAQRIVFFSGAGVSTESGIKDFRSKDGLYNQPCGLPPETIISASYFRKNPSGFFRFYREKMLPLGFEPNVAHRVPARWENEGKQVTVVTQNIDGLHQKAGSTRVCELHGSVLRNYCMCCGKSYPPEVIRDSVDVPKCDCGGIIKPDVVLYEEALDEVTVEESILAINKADLMIVAGTSLTVYPAAGLLQYYPGKHLVLINRDKTPYDSHANLVLHSSLGDIFGKL